MTNIYPVVLSGGSGTRLWPLSRKKYPKQFIKFFSDQEKCLLQEACLRLSAENGFQAPTLLCNRDHRFLVEDRLAAIGIEPRNIILEPAVRNTAPAIAVAALSIIEDDPDAILAVMPSDHMIRDSDRFRDAVVRAADVARSGRLVLLGVAPETPHTGYGYIRRGAELEGFQGSAFAVDSFTEKPEVAKAATYLKDGSYYWNSGIFVLHAGTFLGEMARLGPDVLEAGREALAAAQEDLGFLRLDKMAFSRSPDISIDYAVMEKAGPLAMVQLDAGWSDVGSWSSVWELADRDKDGNYVNGDAILGDTRNCYIHSGRSLVSAIGVEDLVIVDTPDAILVADRSRAQEVGRIVNRIRESNRCEHENHIRQYRPWGYFELLNKGPRFQVKLLHVKPGAKLSMQMHHHRSEHWVVVKGTARVTRGAEERLVSENESFYISATDWHRLENPGKVPVEIIEVQIGAYLGEDDIIRSDDVYNRAAAPES